MPRNTAIVLFSPLDSTLQPAVGEGVLLVELQVTLVFEEALSRLRNDVLDVLGDDDGGGEINKVFLSWLKLEALLSHHRELLRLADEHVEGQVLLVLGAKGDGVGVEVQDELQPILSANLRLDLLVLCPSLHFLDQRLVLGNPQRVFSVQGAAHSRVGGHPLEQVGTVDLGAGQLAGEQHVFIVLTSKAGQR